MPDDVRSYAAADSHAVRDFFVGQSLGQKIKRDELLFRQGEHGSLQVDFWPVKQRGGA